MEKESVKLEVDIDRLKEEKVYKITITTRLGWIIIGNSRMREINPFVGAKDSFREGNVAGTWSNCRLIWDSRVEKGNTQNGASTWGH